MQHPRYLSASARFSDSGGGLNNAIPRLARSQLMVFYPSLEQQPNSYDVEAASGICFPVAGEERCRSLLLPL